MNNSTGQYFKEGEIIKRPKFADTLRRIGESGSVDIFYNGEIAEDIVKEIQKLGGIITLDDLRNFKYDFLTPNSHYTHHNIFITQPHI